LQNALSRLPAGNPKSAALSAPVARKPKGIEVELVKKETRATAISFGFPIGVTRSHPDFAALNVARSWLGEHRSSMSHLYQRIREIRGMNYGDYAYIEAFPGGGGSFFPPSGVPRQAQIFEVWIRPVAPENAHFALRIALHELDALITNGLTQAQFEATRDYLMKNVYLMTARQQSQLGYALDERFYGLGEYAATMREALGKLTLNDVNTAIRKHLSAKDVSVVMVVKDAEGLKKKLVTDALSPITYDATKPAELLEEDQKIGAAKLGIKAESVKITPVEEVFAK
jgi:zinc protease